MQYIGTSFKITPQKKITIQADWAVSGLTRDLSENIFSPDSIKGLEKFFSGFLTVRKSTAAGYAGQTSLSYRDAKYNTVLSYRRVQPEFKSLGTPYMLNDVELINWMNNFYLANGKYNISAVVFNQHNNLKNQLTSELNTFATSFNTTAMLTQYFNINLNYAGYHLKQKDGTLKLKDSARLNQQIHQLSLVPAYTILQNIKSHTVSGNVSYMLLNDKNPVTSPYTSSNNLAASLNYTLGLTKKNVNFTFGTLFSQYNQDSNYHRSYGATLSSTAQVLKKKNLSLQGSAGYIANQSSFGNAQGNLTFSLNLGFNEQAACFKSVCKLRSYIF